MSFVDNDTRTILTSITSLIFSNITLRVTVHIYIHTRLGTNKKTHNKTNINKSEYSNKSKTLQFANDKIKMLRIHAYTINDILPKILYNEDSKLYVYIYIGRYAVVVGLFVYTKNNTVHDHINWIQATIYQP